MDRRSLSNQKRTCSKNMTLSLDELMFYVFNQVLCALVSLCFTSVQNKFLLNDNNVKAEDYCHQLSVGGIA